MAGDTGKRKRPENGTTGGGAKSSAEDDQKKKRKLWRVPKNDRGNMTYTRSTIEPGDAGIWATCSKDKEIKSQHELLDLLEEYADEVYGTESAVSSDEAKPSPSQEEVERVDIEAEINEELAEMKGKKSNKQSRFGIVKTGVQCVLFIKTKPPVDPVFLVHKVCEDAFTKRREKSIRFVKRLVPITKFAKAYETGLVSLAEEVLRPHFGAGTETKKYAIQPNIRHNAAKDLDRDRIIRLVADAVGPRHKVDLTGYDLLILVEVFKNIVGMSVVTSDFRRFKKFNLDELYNPAELEQVRSKAT